MTEVRPTSPRRVRERHRPARLLASVVGPSPVDAGWRHSVQAGLRIVLLSNAAFSLVVAPLTTLSVLGLTWAGWAGLGCAMLALVTTVRGLWGARADRVTVVGAPVLLVVGLLLMTNATDVTGHESLIWWPTAWVVPVVLFLGFVGGRLAWSASFALIVFHAALTWSWWPNHELNFIEAIATHTGLIITQAVSIRLTMRVSSASRPVRPSPLRWSARTGGWTPTPTR